MTEARRDRSCKQCGSQFEIHEEDLTFYQKLDVPPPSHCPECRQAKRMAQVNQLHLFRRNCDATGQPMVTSYSPTAPYKVYRQDYWYSDAVDNTAYGRDFDFSKPFFEQFMSLQRAVPRPALFTDFAHDENSAYTNFAGRNKNCYLLFDSDENWDCYYGYSMNGSKNSLDCYRVENVELCYELIDSRRCYGSSFLYNCENCHDSVLLQNCIGCKNCLMCCNLRQKEYYVFNEPVTKAEYEALRRDLRHPATLAELVSSFQQFKLKFPQKFLVGFQNENVLGNYLTNAKNAFYCFDCRDVWDTRYCFQSFMKLKDCMDVDECGEGELLYECSNIGYNAFFCRFTQICLSQVSNLTYCEICFNGCSDLFGCIGLKKKKHCLLNKQYSEADYKKLEAEVIQHMKKTGEWGEYFPPACATTPYNLSVAQNFQPLTKEKAIAAGYTWQDDAPVTGDVSESESLRSCSSCRKGFKIIPQEAEFYRKQGLPPPAKCFLCRHKDRLGQRLPRQLWARNCDCCAAPLQSAYSPDRPEIVYCEKCYQEALD